MSKYPRKPPAEEPYTYFDKKKSLHFTLRWDTYTQARVTLFQYNLSLTECIEEFAKLLAENSAIVRPIMERCHKRRMNREIEKAQAKSALDLNEIDVDVLYGLIDESSTDGKDDGDG